MKYKSGKWACAMNMDELGLVSVIIHPLREY